MFHIIDDDEDLRGIAVELLNSAGYQVIDYSNPSIYLDYVHSDDYVSPMAIITDVRMPEMSGYELVDKVREKYPDQKFVVISGYDDCDRSLRRNVCHFLPKPFTPEKLISITDSLIKCSKEGPSSAITACEDLGEEANPNWECPLDCFECGNKGKSVKL